jgi:hypothetical protein
MATEAHVWLTVGDQKVSLPQAGSSLGSAIAAHNARARIADVPDTLNPAVIDPAKAERFAAGLSRQAPDTLARMDGHELMLNGQDYGIGAAEPTRPEEFGTFTLVIDEVQGRNLVAHTTVPTDIALARARAKEAEAALRTAEAAVREVEAANVGGEKLSNARRRRAALALAWRTNAGAVAKAVPTDAAAKSSFDAAQKAARDYMMPAGGLL